jgi:hypothetical protein
MASVSVAEYHGAVSPSGWYEAASATAVFKSGHKYVGSWKEGKMHGRGKYEWVDGVTFEGYFNANVAEGYGRYVWPDGGTYEGQIRKGKRHGPGVMSFADGVTRYEGQWEEGKRHGKGTIVFGSSHYYEGDWLDDRKHGFGRYQYENGDWYEGEWGADVKNGEGIARWVADGKNEMYEGHFSDGAPCGEGTHFWFRNEKNADEKNADGSVRFSASVNKYSGGFENGERHGFGTFSYADGSAYVGEFFRGLKHGRGCFVFEDGSRFRGTFRNDRPDPDPYRGGSPFAPAVCLKLDVSDLLDECHDTRDVSVAMERLHKALLRVVSELREAYRATRRRMRMRPTAFLDPKASTVSGFVRFARTRGITGTDFTVAEMARIIAPAWRDSLAYRFPDEREKETREGDVSREVSRLTDARADAKDGFFLDPTAAVQNASFTESSRLSRTFIENEIVPADPAVRPDVLSPTAPLAFREFAECLVRCAHVKFSRVSGIHRRVERLLSEHAFRDADALPWDEIMRLKSMRAVLETRAGALHSCFVAAIRCRPGDVTRRRDPPSVDGRAFLAFLNRKGVVRGDDRGDAIAYPPAEEVPDVEVEVAEGTDGALEAPEGTVTDGGGGGGGSSEVQTDFEPEPEETSGPGAFTVTGALAAFAAAVAPFDAVREAAAKQEAAEAADAAGKRREALDVERRAAGEAAEAAGEATPDETRREETSLEPEASEERSALATAEAMERLAALNLDAETDALMRVLDCEATFSEFVEGLARCAEIAKSGDAGSSVAEKFEAFLEDLI